ncbi:hypothetical protein ACIQB5_49485 [Streptomyces sp. NPDC088560]|uniref:hypothetical protein n=1 Tax=Streptomyces sp. NPDC088560 TaxID=3365868 RepID=UPI00380BB7A1
MGAVGASVLAQERRIPALDHLGRLAGEAGQGLGGRTGTAHTSRIGHVATCTPAARRRTAVIAPAGRGPSASRAGTGR